MNNKAPFSSKLIFPALLVFIGAVLFSSKAVLVKLAYEYQIDSISLLALRMLFALPFYLIIAAWVHTNGPQPKEDISPRDWLAVILLGVFGYYLASLMDFMGLQYISASIERLILFSYPTIVLIFSALLYKDKITFQQLLALLLTYLGISLALVGESSWGENSNFKVGATFIFCSAFTYALYLIFSSRLIVKFGNLRFTSWVMITSSICILIHQGIVNGWNIFDFPTRVYLLTFLMGTIATVIPSFLVSEGLIHIGPSNTAIIGSVGPVSTIVLAYVFLGERLSLLQWLGTLLVIGGVLIISLQKNKKTRRGYSQRVSGEGNQTSSSTRV